MLHDKQLFKKIPVQSTKYRRKKLCVDNKVRETIGDVYCPTCRSENCVYLSTNKTTSFYDCKKCKACCNVLNFPFKDQKPTNMLFDGDGTLCFAKKRSRDYEKPSPFLKKFLSQSQASTYEPEPKKVKIVQMWNKRIRFLLADDLRHMFNFQIVLFNFTLQSTATQLTFNLHKIIMIFSVSSDGIQWTLDFGPDSVTIAVNDLHQNITISSQEIPLAAWQLLLAQRQDFLNNHLARVPITPNQEGTMEMKDEVLSSVGAQDLDTSSYQVFDLEDIEFNWENSQLDDVFRPGIDTPFSPTVFDDLLMGDGSVENPIVLDEEEDKENAPRTPESVRPTEPPRLQRSRAFGARMENVPDYVFRNLFQ